MVVGAFLSTSSCFALSHVPLPDSLLTVDKAIVYCLQSPDTSHAILDHLREKNTVSSSNIDMIEAYIYRRECRYLKAIEVYQRVLDSREVRKDIHLQAMVWRGLILCHDMLMDDLNLTDDLYQLNECGEKADNEVYSAIAQFVMGKRLHHHGLKVRSYDLCLKALEVLKNSDFTDKNRTLILCYHTLSRLYAFDGRFDEALQMSLNEEKLVRDIRIVNIYGELDVLMRFVYGHRATLLAQAGRRAEADQAYEQWKRYEVGHPFMDREILSYLLISNHLDEGLQIVQKYKDYLVREGDSVQVRMLDALFYESHIYSLKDDYQMASHNNSRMASIAYRLNQLSSKKEMGARYQSLLEKERLRERYVWTLCVAFVLLAILIILGILYWHKHNLYKHSMHIQHLLNYIKVYQNAALNEESKEKSSDSSESKTQDESVPVDEDEKLFMELDKKINKGRLFLNPDFSREDMMRLINVDKNRIGRIMSHYSMASNASTYINQKRAAYAAEYILKHPDYTIAAVVEACGMSNAVTLNRAFKELYGVTPSAYRMRLVEEKNHDGID